MHTEARSSKICRIYVHTNEGPESLNGAAGLAGYLAHEDAGYHAIVDNKNLVRPAPDNVVVWAEGGDNSAALSLCFIGYAAQSANEWADPYSKAELEIAAHQIALWAKQYDIPLVKVAPGKPGEAPTECGIAEHAYDHDPRSQGHTDPGAGFPIDALIARAAQIENPVDWHKIAQLAEWKKEVSEAPLHANDTSWKVTVLKQLLAHVDKKYDVGNDSPRFGPKLVQKLALWKHDHCKGCDPSGEDFGATGADALL